ncbi:MAG: restriction endonuclease subunit S [Gemmatimonadaceae bacterium]|nr:restriction endonuclease subunit S [Gemmatimonadaceae bacterium]
MKAAELLAMYERVADAPDAVAKLRRFVLELAVRGRLVEPVVEEALVDLRPDRATNCLHELPQHWRNSSLEALIAEDTRNGLSRKPDDAPDGVPILRISAGTVRADGVVAEEEHKLIGRIEEVTREQYSVRRGDLLACRFNGNKSFVGRLTIFKDYLGLRPLYPDKLIRVRVDASAVIAEFVRLAADSAYVRSQIEALCATTVGNWGISASSLKKVRFPVPPLAEQHRIVAKVDELMALCDQLEAARTEREATRDRLAAASLARLNTPDPDTFQSDARFALNVLPALSTRPEQVKQLRQTVLNLAVRGKLVPQDNGEESAAVLLQRLRDSASESDRVKGSRNRQADLSPPVNPIPYELPPNWECASFARVAVIRANLVDPRGFQSSPHIAPDNIEAGTGRLLPYGSVSMSGVFSAKHRFRSGSLLYSKIRPALAKVVIVDFDGLCSADMYPIEPLIEPRYLQLFMLSPFFVRQSVAEDNRVAMPKINQETLSRLSVAVPPLSEQRRIVAKVNQLIALCDQLEGSLAVGESSRSRLFDALLRQALEPAPQAT